MAAKLKAVAGFCEMHRFLPAISRYNVFISSQQESTLSYCGRLILDLTDSRGERVCFDVAELSGTIRILAADKSGKWCFLKRGETDDGDRRIPSVRWSQYNRYVHLLVQISSTSIALRASTYKMYLKFYLLSSPRRTHRYW